MLLFLCNFLLALIVIGRHFLVVSYVFLYKRNIKVFSVTVGKQVSPPGSKSGVVGASPASDNRFTIYKLCLLVHFLII